MAAFGLGSMLIARQSVRAKCSAASRPVPDRIRFEHFHDNYCYIYMRAIRFLKAMIDQVKGLLYRTLPKRPPEPSSSSVQTNDSLVLGRRPGHPSDILLTHFSCDQIKL